MTIEEKAKAYDEALERAKAYHRNELAGSRKEMMEYIFPQLRESEDERIRKWVIEELEITRDAMSGKNPYSDDPDIVARLKRLDEAIAYLEKQKYDRMKPIYDARESFESALEKAWNDYHNGYENVDRLEDDYVECAHAKGFREGYLFGIEKQKEQQPADEQFPPLEGLDAIKAKYYDDGFKNGFDEGVESVKPAEWSEEEQTIIEGACNALEIYGHSKLADKLKSLRPQPHWKPSEEQMKHLERCFSHGHTSQLPNQHILESLYNELKKLT